MNLLDFCGGNSGCICLVFPYPSVCSKDKSSLCKNRPGRLVTGTEGSEPWGWLPALVLPSFA